MARRIPLPVPSGHGRGQLGVGKDGAGAARYRGLNSGPLSFQRHHWLLALLQQEQNGCGDDERPETGFLVKQHLLPSLADDQTDDALYEQAMQVPGGLRPELLARTLKLFHGTS